MAPYGVTGFTYSGLEKATASLQATFVVWKSLYFDSNFAVIFSQVCGHSWRIVVQWDGYTNNYIYCKAWNKITHPFEILQRLCCWSLGMYKHFHPLPSLGVVYLSMLGLVFTIIRREGLALCYPVQLNVVDDLFKSVCGTMLLHRKIHWRISAVQNIML